MTERDLAVTVTVTDVVLARMSADEWAEADRLAIQALSDAGASFDGKAVTRPDGARLSHIHYVGRAA